MNLFKKYQDVLSSVIDERTMLILDEVHKIKGIESSRAQSVMAVTKRAKLKYALTGTPFLIRMKIYIIC